MAVVAQVRCVCSLTNFVFFQPAFQNVAQRVEEFVKIHLKQQIWTPAANKNHMREVLRKSLSGYVALAVLSKPDIRGRGMDPALVVPPKYGNLTASNILVELRDLACHL